MKRIFTARYLLPGDAPPISGGALLDLNGRIAAVGRCRELHRSNPGVETLDFGEALLLPLLVNAHTHLELTDCPLWSTKAGETEEPKDFVDWILRLIRIKKTLSKQDYTRSLSHGIEQSLAAGSGAVGDILSQYGCRDAFRGTPLLGTLFLETLGQDPAVIARRKQDLDLVLAEQTISQLQLGVSPHSPYTISTSYLADLYKKCRQENLPCTTHLAESAAEIDFIGQGHGELASKLYPFIGWEAFIPPAKNCSPVEYLQRLGGLFTGNLLVHGVQLSTADIELLAEKRMSLVLCPRSNARLKVGKAPLAQLQRAGVRLSLGTDSLASNDSLSIWDEVAFAASWFGSEVDAPELFRMATQGGAEALGLQTQLGSLSSGKLSSFQVLQPDALPAENQLYDFLTAPGRTAEIDQVYLQGEARLPAAAEKLRIEATAKGDDR